MTKPDRFETFCDRLFHHPRLGLSLDVGRMGVDPSFLSEMAPLMERSFFMMRGLERGEIANPDEGRMVGHYWLRAPGLAPDPRIRDEIVETRSRILDFAHDIHSGAICSPTGRRYDTLLVIGIGGSALGPQLVSDALGGSDDRMSVHFLDNTDPDGMDRVFALIGSHITTTLALVISKSGGTKETRNGMLEAAWHFRERGVVFERNAVAITGAGSELDRLAQDKGWLARFPMWDWVGGRTSVTSAVGLLPMALQGIDVQGFLEGARLMDEATRSTDVTDNPAALLALSWYRSGGGRGDRAMVVLPYKDRLVLFSRYLQQLVMESLGKERSLDGAIVSQGLTVYGNKGSTDQHAYIQQLRDGRDDFFVTFIQVLKDREGGSGEVEEGITSGDYLAGFLHGTREALTERGRGSILLTVEELTPLTLGALIALYERAVGLYAGLINVNAYHQPGVEAGKKAAGRILDLSRRVMEELSRRENGATAPEIAAAIGETDHAEMVFQILRHRAANPGRGVWIERKDPITSSRFGWEGVSYPEK